MSVRLERIEKIRQLQRKLYLKAKQEPDFRFYIMYDKIHCWDILVRAWQRVKANDGSPGADGLSFADIEKQGLRAYLKELQRELEEMRYKPDVVLRRYIEKEDGKERPLGIPTIRDRIAQMACKIVVEPIFEADFQDNSYGYRPKKSAKDAIARIKSHLRKGYTEVMDCDLSQYFDTIPHGQLMQYIEQRISDKRVVMLIRMWLKAPVVERRGNGKLRYISGKRNNRGTPQGGIISPLLSNIYLNELDKEFYRRDGILNRCGARLVRYADDMVVLARYIGHPIENAMRSYLKELGLTLNEEKTHIVKTEESSFDFLGYTFRYDRHLDGRDGKYLNIFPSRKSQKRLRGEIQKVLVPGNKKDKQALVRELNQKLVGWRNYFSAPGTYPRKACRDMNWYLRKRLDRFYRRKSQRHSKFHGTGAYNQLLNSGLVVL